MKNLFTLLSHLRGSMGNLQSSDVRHDCRLTVGSPSGLDAKWKQNPFMRFAVVLTLIFTLGVGNAWGAAKTVTYTVTGKSTVSTSGTAPTGSSASFSQTYNTAKQATAGNSFTLTLSNFNVNVTKFTFSMHSNSGQGKGNLSYKVDSGSEIFLVGSSSSSATGFNSWGDNTSYGNSYRNVNWNVDFTPTSSLVIYIRCVTTNSIYVESFTLTYEEAAAEPHTVRFYTASGTYTDLTEGSANAGVTPPTMSTPCDGWAFQGWSTSYSNSSTSTTVLSTVTLTDGKYYPEDDITLYPVYTKTVSGVSSTASSNTVNAGSNSAVTLEAGKPITYRCSSSNTYGNPARIYKGASVTIAGGTITGVSLTGVSGYAISNMTANVGTLTTSGNNGSWSGSATSVTFTASAGQTRISAISVTYTGGSTTYYYSYPTCCTPLGTINGSVNWSNPTTAVVTWNKLADQVTSWALSWSPNTAGSSITSAIADAGGGTQKTATVSGLACGTEYTFTVTPTVNSGVCTPASNPTIVSTSTKYSITRSGSPAGTVTGGTFTTKISGSAVTEACNGSTIQIAATPATGYEFTSWTISKAGGGTVSPAASTASTTFTMPSDNVTVTAAFSCVTPTWSTNLTEETVNYLTGGSATALSVAASASGATINYQWQTKVGDGAWTNSGTNASGNTSITPSTAGPGTTSYRCIATNAASGCSTTATSNVVTVVVTNPSGYCISAFNSSNNGITGGFSNGGSGNHYTLSYTIPGKSGGNWPQFWIGENESFQSSFSVNANFADMPLMSNNSATLGLAEGATGTLHIWNDNIQASSNLFIKFEPSGYGLRWGGAGEWNQAANTKAFTVDPGDANVYWTDIVTLDGTNNTTWNYYVGLQTASGYIYSGVDNEASDSRGISRTGSVTAMKVSNGTNGSFKATYLNSEPTNSRGKFRIWINNISAYNFVCHWVPFYRVTYNGNGASGSVAASADVCCEGNAAARTVKAAANEFTAATGKQFAGWATSAGGAKVYDPNDDIVLTADVVLYPVWEDIDYTVTVNQSPSIGAKTTGQTSSAHYNGTINLTTTVPSGYRFVNWTTSDGFSITNSTSATTASFTMPAKDVTVTANFQQTHTVDWYVGGSAPANKIGDDGQTTVVDHGGKIEDFPATTPDGSACEKTFVGWTNTSDYVHGTSPLFTDVAGSPQINADAQFYAVFATVNSVSTSLTKMTADDDLEVGDKIVIIAQDTRYGMYQASASSYVSYWTTTDVDGEPSLSEIEADDKKYLDVAAGGVTDTWKLGDATNGYLYNSSSTNLEFSTTNSSDLTLIKWTDDSFTFQAGQYISCRTDLTGTNANKWRGAGASCDPEEGTNCSGTEYYYLYKYVPGGTTATGHTINCADCGTSVTPTYTAAPTGGKVSVTKSATPVTSGSTVKTCTAVDLTVTITPASHYTLTGFTATGLSTGTATISPVVAETLPKTTETTFTVTVSAGATGTLNLTPTFTEDAHKVISWVVHGGSASIDDGHGTTWVYSGEDLTAIPTAPDAPTGCVGKTFVGWSENDGGATEEDASYYDDLFTTLVGAPTGITTDKTFTAVFATPAAGLGGTVMWEEDFSGFSANDAPNTSYGSAHTGTTVYNSGSVTYACTNGGSDTKVYTSQISAGGTSPELLVGKNTGVFAVTNIPTGGQTELTLTYKSNKSANDFTVTSGTSGVTIGDASNSGTTYTRTITISQSPSATNSFALSFSMTANSNARLDDISLVVPGSSSSSAYVTTCEETYTITYNKNTTDPVTNLPSPTGISQATGSGTLSSKVPVRYAYTFMGWATTAEGSVAYAAGAAISSVGADMTLYAVWEETAVTEINLSKSSLDKYVGDPSVTLTVTSVLPDGASTDVIWSSSNSSIATVSASGEVNFIAAGTATITATSSITSGTTATCAVTVWAKPSVSFLDNLHSLTEDKDGNALSGYNLTDVAGTPVVFPILANQPAGSGTCEDEFYVFIGWTTSDNNTDPEDHLVTSHNLTNGDNITYYAVWADGVSGTTYVQLTSNSFSTSKHYVIGAVHPDNGTTYYFNSCAKTDKDNSWGYVTADLASDTPIEFTLSGTASALVATTTESTSRYLKPTSTNEFHMSSISQTIMLKSDGKIYSTDETRRLLLNKSQPGLRWYGTGTVSGTSNAYFYEVVAGGEVNYRTSCCADKVAAPTVTATKTSTTVTLTWAAVSGATGYELQWNGGAWTAATSGVVKSDLTPNTNYSWRVRATYVPPKCGADIASGSTTTNQVYHVTYAKGSGTGSCNATSSTTDDTAYEAGATVTLQSNGFTLVGHTFNEWTEDDEDITISSNQFTMPEHDVVITATWTPKVDKFYDRMHDGTDASHGGIADGDGKYYITREGCSYTVPSLTDNTSGATACHTKHYVLMGWTAESHLNSDGTLKTGHEGYVYTGGGTQTATGATYYAVWAEVEE